MGMGYHTGWAMGGGLFMIIFWIALVVLLVFGVRWLIYGMPGKSDRDRDSEALKTLKERYARGEMDREEFEQKKRDLQGP